MKYSICMKSDLSHSLVSKSLNSDFAAEKWAREWAAANGTSEEYILRREDGGYAASLFRTVGGQWYIMWLEPAK
jgi:hypothetical protein